MHKSKEVITAGNFKEGFNVISTINCSSRLVLNVNELATASNLVLKHCFMEVTELNI